MKRQIVMLTAACMMIVKVHSLPPEKLSAEKLKVQQQEQKSGSETSSYTVSSEQLEAIDAVIDGIREQWIFDVRQKEREIRSLTEKRKFWVRVSLCEALVIVTGAYFTYAMNK